MKTGSGFEKDIKQQNFLVKSGSCPRVAMVYSACHRSGGVERVLVETANHLARHGFSPTVYASRYGSSEDLDSRVERRKVALGGLPLGLGLPLFQRQVSRKIADAGHDVIAGFGVQAPAGSVLWVQSVHAAWWEQCMHRRKGRMRWMQRANPFHRVILGMEKAMFAGRRYRRLVALTDKVRDDLGRFYGVPSRDVDILPNGYSPAEFNLGLRDRFRMQIRARLGIPADAWVVLFVANEWERKGLQPLMEALFRWRKQAVHLVVAGRLPEKRMQQLELRYGLKGRCHFVGGREPVNTWFGIADAFALPTLYEAWGMVIVEALASGLPVLTSACAGAAVAVRHTYNGILLQDPSSASEILAGLLRLRRCIRTSPEQISESVSQYEWPRLLARYEEIIGRAL